MATLRATPGLEPDETSPAQLDVDDEISFPEFILRYAEPEDTVSVTLYKETPTTRIGIGLRADMPHRPVVHTVAPGSPASQPPTEGGNVAAIMPYDELLSIGGVHCESAVHAVKLIREAPAGPLAIEKLPCPAAVVRAATAASRALRAGYARREGLSRRVVEKPEGAVLGLSFSPDWLVHSVIAGVKEGGLAATVLKAGDVVVRLNGEFCEAPAATAKKLRESIGRLELLIVPAGRADEAAMREVEAPVRAQAEAEEAERERRAMAPPEPEYEDDDLDEDFGEEEEDDEDYEEETGLPPRPAGGARDPFPVPGRPAAVATGGARRLPPSLSALSPSGSDRRSPEPQIMPPAGGMAPTSSTRRGGPPLAQGAKPQGWREWLQQRRAMATAVTKPAPEPHSPRATEQRV